MRPLWALGHPPLRSNCAGRSGVARIRQGREIRDRDIRGCSNSLTGFNGKHVVGVENVENLGVCESLVIDAGVIHVSMHFVGRNIWRQIYADRVRSINISEIHGGQSLRERRIRGENRFLTVQEE